MKNENQSKIIRVLIIVFFFLFLVNLVSTLNKNNKSSIIMQENYTSFVKDVDNNKIKSVSIVERTRGPNELKVVPKEGNAYLLNAPRDNSLIGELVSHDVQVSSVPEPGPSFLETFFFTWGPTIFFLVAWIFLMKKMSSGSKGGLFSFGKSKAQLVDPSKIKEGFKDVVGCDEAKLEVQEFVDFLKNPEKFTKLGGRIPRGLLLTGPAGTGKTMLARALAKESGVPFFAISGSEFVEMFVGVGAARVRDMFETAKKVAPCVLFIDEIDAIGGKRGASMGGGNDEREQTLNQILVELDGMDTHKGIILVGATNRPEHLDKALLRPGRIDRQIVVGLPDVLGREEILKIHSSSVPLSTHVNLGKIARGTPGFSGAELANIINEASIFAGRRGKKFVEQKDLEDAKDKVMMGPERPSLAMDEDEKRDTAYHESGHAIIARLVKNSDPVHKVTIIPRGRSLGLTMQLPEKDKHSHKVGFLKDKITILMGGRLAEEIFCDTMTTGASNDIKVATNIARNMVTEWGMSSLGPIAYGDKEDSSFLGNGRLDNSTISPETQLRVDREVQKIITDEYERGRSLLTEHRSKVEAMTNALMEVETLDDWQIDNIMLERHFNDEAGFTESQEVAAERERKYVEEKNRKQSILFPDVNLGV